MKKYLIFALLLVIICCTSFGVNNNQKDMEEEAEEAFYSIFNSYRSNNCDDLLSFLNDSIIFINTPKDTVFKTYDIIDSSRFCSKAFERINKNLDESSHKKNYTVNTFTFEEFSKYKNSNILKDSSLVDLSSDTQMALMFLGSKSHRFDEHDVFVTGIETKNKEEIEYKIGWFKLYFFVLRKTVNGWKIKALSS